MMKKKKNFEDKEMGFGNSVADKPTRMVNENGDYNIVRKGINFFDQFSMYHKLISISWFRFNFLVILFFLAVNFIFSGLYMLAGVQYLSGIIGTDFIEQFWEAFFFSAQTLTTVGYGRVNPVGISANIIASIESLMGLLSFALATGVLYGRFSRPVAKILFSDHAVIAPYKDMNAWMFRIANERSNQLIEPEVQITLSMVVEENGKHLRKFFSLELERTKITFFPTSWTIVHPIDENSPIWEINEKEFNATSPEFLIMFKAYDDIFNSHVHARRSYTFSETLWARKFISMMSFDKKGKTIVHMDKLSTSEPMLLNSSTIKNSKPERASES